MQERDQQRPCLINIQNMPIGCLYNSISKLEPPKISLVAQAKTHTENLSDLCLSNSLWKKLYSYNFKNFEFQTSQRNDDVDWLSRYAKRYAIATNIKTNKPKVKSFVNNDICKIRTLTNAFAFNTPKDISLVVYDYLDNECRYEQSAKFDIQNNDFVFLKNHTMVSVGDVVALFDLDKNTEIMRSNSIRYRFLQGNDDRDEVETHIQPIGESSFAILWNKNGTVYDTREQMFSSRCHFYCDSNVIATAYNDSHLYIATPSGITAYETRASRGQILWKKYFPNDESTFCDFNTDSQTALLGNRVIDLRTGKSLAFYDPAFTDNTDRNNAGIRHNRRANMPIHGAIVNKQYAVFGFDKRAVVLFDYTQKGANHRYAHMDDDQIAANTGKVASNYEFADGGIKSISTAQVNDVIAVAADYSIKILKIPKKQGDQLKDVRSVTTGSIGARKRNEIGPIKQVVFDGERIVTNMGTFVRVYDFYTGKEAKPIQHTQQ